MPDKLIKTIPACANLWLWLYESTEHDGGSYICIRHTQRVSDMPGEILASPVEVPQLIQALTAAALELHGRGMYSASLDEEASDQ